MIFVLLPPALISAARAAGVTRAVRGLLPAEIRQVRLELHDQIDDQDPGLPGRVEDSSGRLDHRPDCVDSDPCTAEHAVRRGEVVLHVDDDDSGRRGIEVEWVWSGGHMERLTVSCHQAKPSRLRCARQQIKLSPWASATTAVTAHGH